MDLELSGRRVVVTGGSRGIGLATATAFAAEGAEVLICARDSDRLAEAARDVETATGRAIRTVAADVASLADIDRLTARVRDDLGGVDVLVNNAGTGTYKPFLEVTDDELVDGMAINFFAQFRISQRLVPMMMAAGGGAIINVSGRTSIRTAFPPGSTCTGPAKAAENRFSADLGAELIGHGIRVVCVVPGVVATPDRFAKWEREALGRELTEAEAAGLRDRLETELSAPAGNRWGDPRELADVIVFLASPRASYVSGTSLVVDGSPGSRSYVRSLYEQQDG